MNDLLTACKKETPKGKTVKCMLEELDAILKEIGHEVGMIADAVYRGSEPTQCREKDDELVKNPPMAVIIENHVNHAEILLKEIVKIREAMW